MCWLGRYLWESAYFLGFFFAQRTRTAFRADRLRSSAVILITPREPAQPPGLADIHYYLPSRIEEKMKRLLLIAVVIVPMAHAQITNGPCYTLTGDCASEPTTLLVKAEVITHTAKLARNPGGCHPEQQYGRADCPAIIYRANWRIFR